MVGAHDDLSFSGASALKDEEWDETLLAMLSDSYREITGRGMPAGLTPGAAYAELRALQVAAWQEEGLAELVEETEDEVRALSQSLSGSAHLGVLDVGGGRASARSCREFDADELDAGDADTNDGAGGADAGSAKSGGADAGGADGDGTDAGGAFLRLGGSGVGVDEDWSPGERGPSASVARAKTGKDVFRTVAAASFSSSADKVYEGWLTKKGPGLLKGDKVRFFVLFDNGEVHYFKHAELTEHKGMFTLDGLSFGEVQLLGKGADGHYGLTVKTAARLWQLRASSEGQARAWKKNMDAIISQKTGQPLMSTKSVK